MSNDPLIEALCGMLGEERAQAFIALLKDPPGFAEHWKAIERAHGEPYTPFMRRFALLNWRAGQEWMEDHA